MAGRLEDLVKPLGELTEGQLEEHLAEVRSDRMTSKRQEKVKRKAKIDATEKVRRLTAGMTDAEKAQFLTMLEEG